MSDLPLSTVIRRKNDFGKPLEIRAVDLFGNEDEVIANAYKAKNPSITEDQYLKILDDVKTLKEKARPKFKLSSTKLNPLKIGQGAAENVLATAVDVLSIPSFAGEGVAAFVMSKRDPGIVSRTEALGTGIGTSGAAMRERFAPTTAPGRVMRGLLFDAPVAITQEFAEIGGDAMYNALPESTPIPIRAGLSAAVSVVPDAMLMIVAKGQRVSKMKDSVRKQTNQLMNNADQSHLLIAEVDRYSRRADKLSPEELGNARRSLADAGITPGMTDRDTRKVLAQYNKVRQKRDNGGIAGEKSAERMVAQADIDAALLTEPAPVKVVPTTRVKGQVIPVTDPKAAYRAVDIDPSVAGSGTYANPFLLAGTNKKLASTLPERKVKPPREIRVIENAEGAMFSPDAYRANLQANRIKAANRKRKEDLLAKKRALRPPQGYGTNLPGDKASGIFTTKPRPKRNGEGPNAGLTEREVFIKENMDRFVKGALARDDFTELMYAATYAERMNAPSIMKDATQAWLSKMSKMSGTKTQKGVTIGTVANEYGLTREQFIQAMHEYTRVLQRTDKKTRRTIQKANKNLERLAKNHPFGQGVKVIDSETREMFDRVLSRSRKISAAQDAAEGTGYGIWHSGNNAVRGLMVSGVNTQMRNMITEVGHISLNWAEQLLAGFARSGGYWIKNRHDFAGTAAVFNDRLRMGDLFTAANSRVRALGEMASGKDTFLKRELGLSPEGRAVFNILGANPANEFQVTSRLMKGVTILPQMQRRLIGTWSFEAKLAEITRRRGYKYRSTDRPIRYTAAELDEALTHSFEMSFGASANNAAVRRGVNWFQNATGITIIGYPRFMISNLVPFVINRTPGLGFTNWGTQLGPLSRRRDFYDKVAQQTAGGLAMTAGYFYATNNPDYIVDGKGERQLNPDADSRLSLTEYFVGNERDTLGRRKVVDVRTVAPVTIPVDSAGINPAFMAVHSAVGRYMGRIINYLGDHPEERKKFYEGLQTNPARAVLSLPATRAAGKAMMETVTVLNERGAGSGTGLMAVVGQLREGNEVAFEGLLAEYVGKIIATAGIPLSNISSLERQGELLFGDPDLAKKSMQSKKTSFGGETRWSDLPFMLADKGMPQILKDNVGLTDPAIPSGQFDPLEKTPFNPDPRGSDRTPLLSMGQAILPANETLKSTTELEFTRLGISPRDVWPKENTKIESLYMSQEMGKLFNTIMPRVLADPNYAQADIATQRVRMKGVILPIVKQLARGMMYVNNGQDAKSRLAHNQLVNKMRNPNPLLRIALQEVGFDADSISIPLLRGEITQQEAVEMVRSKLREAVGLLD